MEKIASDLMLKLRAHHVPNAALVRTEITPQSVTKIDTVIRSHLICPRQQHFFNTFEFSDLVSWAESVVVLINVCFDSFTIFLEAYSFILSSGLTR